LFAYILRFNMLSSWLGYRSLVCWYLAPFDTLAAITDTVIFEVINKFVSNYTKNRFPLEAKVGIDAIYRFKQSTNSLREKLEVKARNEKLVVQS
jgi:hypothetical protein